MIARRNTPEAQEKRWRIWQQMPLLVALVLLWMLLWAEFSWLSFTSGIVVAVLTTRLFFLPPVELSGRFSPLHLLWFLLALSGQIIVASVEVASRAFGPRVRGNSIVAVPLVSDSDFVMSLTATAVSLVPGSIVIEIDREARTLYLHAIGATDEAALGRVRAEVLTIEARLIRAIGSRADLERLRA